MAHNINFTKGKASFVSKKELAWHGLGTVVEAMTSKQAIILGGLDFHVEKRRILTTSTSEILERPTDLPIIRGEEDENKRTPYHTGIIVPNKYATIRTDTDVPLGVVGSKYEVIQNHEAFEFIDSIIGENKADYETVGALGNGEDVFITCKLREEMLINKDLVDKYLLLKMSHDGSGSIIVIFTPIRVVCNNTLSLALKGATNKVAIRHTKSAKQNLYNAKRVLGIVDIQTRAYQIEFERLSTVHVTDDQAVNIMQQSFNIPMSDKGELSAKGMNILQSAMKWYHEGVGQADIVGTAWGVFNGITGYLQNGKEYKNEEAKFKSINMTTGATTRGRAYENLKALV